MYPDYCRWRRVHCVPSRMYSRPSAGPGSGLEESWYLQPVYIFWFNAQIQVSRLSKVASSLESTVSLHQTLHHPNIASLYSVTSVSSADYHVLEFCSEGNLSDLLSSRNPSILSEAELRRVIKGVGSALAYLKEERVIHRNVCPSTILFAEDLKPVSDNTFHNLTCLCIWP
jgi:serine/threonine protein kinase